MFDSDRTKVGSADRLKTAILISGGLFVLIAAGYFVLKAERAKPVLTSPPVQTLEGASRDGSPEFEACRKLVTIEEQKAVESENLLGQVTVVVRGVLHNKGDRRLTGVELRAVVTGQENEVVAERIAVPVPKLRRELQPGESMVVHVNIDPVPRKSIRTNGVILLHGLKFD